MGLLQPHGRHRSRHGQDALGTRPDCSPSRASHRGALFVGARLPARPALTNIDPLHLCGTAMSLDRSVRWRGFDPDKLEHCHVTSSARDTRIRSAIITPTFGLFYRLKLDEAGQVRTVRLERTDGAVLELFSDGAGNWSDDRAEPLPELRGCIDVDISASSGTMIALPLSRRSTSDAVPASNAQVCLLAPPERCRRLRTSPKPSRTVSAESAAANSTSDCNAGAVTHSLRSPERTKDVFIEAYRADQPPSRRPRHGRGSGPRQRVDGSSISRSTGRFTSEL